MERLSTALHDLASSQGVTLSETDFHQFQQQVSGLDLNVDLTEFPSIAKLKDKFSAKGNLFEILSYVVSPDQSSCGLINNLNQLPEGSDCEVWFEGEAILAPTSVQNKHRESSF